MAPSLAPLSLPRGDLRLVLANAVYFKASWLSPFEKPETQYGPFILRDGSEVTVPLIRQTSHFP
jgi:serpin B